MQSGKNMALAMASFSKFVLAVFGRQNGFSIDLSKGRSSLKIDIEQCLDCMLQFISRKKNG